VKTNRKYEMRRRAERQDETRQRIVDATVALHEEQGMMLTTISSVAARAGVERATVYRHFPDERALIVACTNHYFGQHPLPDSDAWLVMTDPVERLQLALADIYAYHRSTERMIASTASELPRHPVAQEVVAPMIMHLQRVREILASGWSPKDEHVQQLTAAIGHAIAFGTWQSLVREQRLDDPQAVELMVTLVSAFGAPDGGSPTVRDDSDSAEEGKPGCLEIAGS
jgi:AcrR family transcriptional regulator